MITDKELTELIEYNALKNMKLYQNREVKRYFKENLEFKTRLYKRFLFSNFKKQW